MIGAPQMTESDLSSQEAAVTYDVVLCPEVAPEGGHAQENM
jgi:hypothetical protein